MSATLSKAKPDFRTISLICPRPLEIRILVGSTAIVDDEILSLLQIAPIVLAWYRAGQSVNGSLNPVECEPRADSSDTVADVWRGIESNHL